MAPDRLAPKRPESGEVQARSDPGPTITRAASQLSRARAPPVRTLWPIQLALHGSRGPASAPQRRLWLVDLGTMLGWATRSRELVMQAAALPRGLIEGGPIPRRRRPPGDPRPPLPTTLSVIRSAARAHARDVRELVIDVLEGRQRGQLVEISSALLAALKAQEPRRD